MVTFTNLSLNDGIVAHIATGHVRLGTRICGTGRGRRVGVSRNHDDSHVHPGVLFDIWHFDY